MARAFVPRITMKCRLRPCRRKRANKYRVTNRPRSRIAVLHAQKKIRKTAVNILRRKNLEATIKETLASTTPFAASMLSSHRVDRRFDLYSPHIVKIRCQRASSTRKITKFQSFTFTDRTSTRDASPDADADRIVARPNDRIKAAKSNAFNELS